MEPRNSGLSLSFNWRWIITAYSYYVILHAAFALLSPMTALYWRPSPQDFYNNQDTLLQILSTGFVISVVGVYVGWKSEKLAVIDAGLAAVLYVLTLIMLFPGFAGIEPYRMSALFRVAECIWAFVLAFAGAAIGKWIHLRRDRLHHQVGI